jgi:hypothetical protein
MYDGVINHRYGEIQAGLDESNRSTQALQEAKENLIAGFSKLHSSGCFEGAAGQQLLVTQQRIGQRMDDCAATLNLTSQRAVQQQEETQALDFQGANSLGG